MSFFAPTILATGTPTCAAFIPKTPIEAAYASPDLLFRGYVLVGTDHGTIELVDPELGLVTTSVTVCATGVVGFCKAPSFSPNAIFATTRIGRLLLITVGPSLKVEEAGASAGGDLSFCPPALLAAPEPQSAVLLLPDRHGDSSVCVKVQRTVDSAGKGCWSATTLSRGRPSAPSDVGTVPIGSSVPIDAIPSAVPASVAWNPSDNVGFDSLRGAPTAVAAVADGAWVATDVGEVAHVGAEATGPAMHLPGAPSITALCRTGAGDVRGRLYTFCLGTAAAPAPRPAPPLCAQDHSPITAVCAVGDTLVAGTQSGSLLSVADGALRLVSKLGSGVQVLLPLVGDVPGVVALTREGFVAHYDI